MPAVDTAKKAYDYTITMTDANVEYSQELPDGVIALEMRCRDGTAFRHSFTTGKVATPTNPYNTVLANGEYKKEGLYLRQHTLYMACGSGSKVVELRVWTS